MCDSYRGTVAVTWQAYLLKNLRCTHQRIPAGHGKPHARLPDLVHVLRGCTDLPALGKGVSENTPDRCDMQRGRRPFRPYAHYVTSSAAEDKESGTS